MLVLKRENDFVREFSLDGTDFIDSKYRTLELPFRADYFIERWLRADERLRSDMELAVADFPSVAEVEVNKILEFLARTDQARAERVRDSMAQQWVPIDDERLRFYVEIFKEVMRQGAAGRRLVGENRWFVVIQTIAELSVEPKPAFSLAPPDDSELLAMAGALPEGLYKWAIEIFVASPKLTRARQAILAKRSGETEATPASQKASETL